MSAAQPNMIMPSIAKAIVPVLKKLKTRASISFGVLSCSPAETIGVTSPAAPPIATINTKANIGVTRRFSPNTATPAIMADPAISHNWLHVSGCFFQASHPVVMRMPTLNTDQSHPNSTGPACSTLSPKTGRRYIKPVAPTL